MEGLKGQLPSTRKQTDACVTRRTKESKLSPERSCQALPPLVPRPGGGLPQTAPSGDKTSAGEVALTLSFVSLKKCEDMVGSLETVWVVRPSPSSASAPVREPAPEHLGRE